MDLVKDDFEAQNFINDMSYNNPYETFQMDSTGKPNCYAKERCVKESKRNFGSLMKTPPP